MFAARTHQGGASSAELAASYTVASEEPSPGPADGGIRLNSSGAVETMETTGVWNPVGTWLTAGTPSDFECRMVTGTGVFDTGTMDTWLDCSSTRTWAETKSTAGTETATGTLELRRKSDGVTVDSASVSVSATIL